jgi:hypothetical protein
MTELYVANVSKQICNFAYRAPERSGVVIQVIPIGGQILVAPNGTNTNLNTLEVEAILKQYEKYGLVPVDELGTAPFNGLCYSLDKPISVDKLKKAMTKLEESLAILGRKMRSEAALAVNSQIETQIGAPLRQLEMSFTEEEPRAGYSDDVEHLSEGVRVTRAADPDKFPSLARGRRQ